MMLKSISVQMCAVLCAIFFLVTGVAAQQDRITGAFGLEFGAEGGGSAAPSTGVYLWPFTPEVVSPFFAEYGYYTTPISNRIFAAQALSDPMDRATCLDQATRVSEIILARYNIVASWQYQSSDGESVFRGNGSGYYTFHWRLRASAGYIEISCLVEFSGTAIPPSRPQQTSDFQCERENMDGLLAGGYFHRFGNAAALVQNHSTVSGAEYSLYNGRYFTTPTNYTSGHFFFFDEVNWRVWWFENRHFVAMPRLDILPPAIERCFVQLPRPVVLSIRYGSEGLEREAWAEMQEAERDSTISAPDAQGL